MSQTKQSVKTSPRYLPLSARQKRAVDALADRACAALASITPRLSASQKARLITAYQTAITALGHGGWLSDSEATRLKALANQLDDLRPIAVITGPLAATPGVSVLFSGALSSDPDGNVASYAWSWGDGTPDDSGVAPSHTYTASGSHTVTLVVTDNKGATSDPATLVVVANAKPTAVIDDPGPGLVGVEFLEFTGGLSTDPDGTIESYVWTWGDGTPDGSGVSPSHIYSAAGIYTVTLVVTDDLGASSDPASVEVTVNEATTGGPCDSLQLSDTSSNLIASAFVLPLPDSATGCALYQVVPEPNVDYPATDPADQVDAAGLFGSGSTAIANHPAGYTRISDAVQFAAADIGGNKVRMCFTLPSNYTSYKSQKIAYYDTTPTINRWVFLQPPSTRSPTRRA